MSFNQPIVIALTGKARSGKDTVAQYIHHLVQSYNDQPHVEHKDSYVVGIEAFAAPIKSMVAMLLDFFGLGEIMNPATLQPYIDGSKKEEKLPMIGKSARELMQTLGTEWGRDAVKESLWLDCMTQRINRYDEAEKHGYKGAYVVVTDCRFDDEARALTDRHGAVIIHVVRDDTPDTVGVEDHPSEAGVSPALIDRTIINNGTKEDLLKSVHKALEDVLPELQLPFEETNDNDES